MVMTSNSGQKHEWKQINRAQKIWSAMGREIDVDPDDWITFLGVLESLGYDIRKVKSRKAKASRRFLRIIKE